MDLFEQYNQLCDKIYDSLIQENSLLKKGNPPTDHILQSKKNMLSELDPIISELKKITSLNHSQVDVANKIKQKLMKIFMLDKENEKLLLELQTPNLIEKRYSVSMSKLKSMYM